MANKNYLNNKKLTAEDFIQLTEEGLQKMREEELYDLRNDAKLRAVCTSKTYDEFKNIVDAAHLTPLSNKDKMDSSTRSRLWNSASKHTKL